MDLSKDMNDKIVKFSWRKWVIGIIFVLLTIGVVMLFSINGAQNVNHALTDGTILENVYYVTQIVASLAVVIGGIIGVWQYTLTTKAERSKMNIECIQRAIDLAEYYKNNILKKYAPIQFVYKNSGLMEIVKKIDKSKIDVFDKTELNGSSRVMVGKKYPQPQCLC